MKPRLQWAWLLLIAATISYSFSMPRILQKEFLTPLEIEKIQDAQEIDKRVKLYLDAAALRLKTAEERLNGKESAAGDPMEFFSPEDMVEGYYRCIRSVMLNLDGAAQNPKTEPASFNKALKYLKQTTENEQKSLTILKSMAEEKKKEELWNWVNRALDVSQGAYEGAVSALAKEPSSGKEEKGPPKKKSRPTLGPPEK
jgi:hypothetical protein